MTSNFSFRRIPIYYIFSAHLGNRLRLTELGEVEPLRKFLRHKTPLGRGAGKSQEKIEILTERIFLHGRLSMGIPILDILTSDS